MLLKYKKLNPKAIIPTRSYKSDSGLDLYACLDEPVELMPGCKALIPTGIALDLPKPCSVSTVEDSFLTTYKEIVFEGQIRPKSGLAAKHFISCHFGTIDQQYKGELLVNLFNFSVHNFKVEHGMKIAQLVIVPVLIPSVLVEVVDLSASDRAANGFGSTGVSYAKQY